MDEGGGYNKFEKKMFPVCDIESLFSIQSYLVVFDGVDDFSFFTFDRQDVAGNFFEFPLPSRHLTKPYKKTRYVLILNLV